MTPLPLPFWIVFQSKEGVPGPVVLPSLPGFAAVFSTAQNATAYVVSHDLLSFSMRLVSRGGLPGLVNRLQAMGLRGFCYDPNGDATGTPILFADLEAAGYLQPLQ